MITLYYTTTTIGKVPVTVTAGDLSDNYKYDKGDGCVGFCPTS